MTYAEKLKDPRWQKKRLEILNRDNFTCKLCGDTESTLHVHHKSYGPNPWDSKNNKLITYCLHCHSLIEYCKDDRIKSVPVRVFKEVFDTACVLYVLQKNDSNYIAIYLYQYNNETRSIDFISAILPDFIELINKEISRQKKRK